MDATENSHLCECPNLEASVGGVEANAPVPPAATGNSVVYPGMRAPNRLIVEEAIDDENSVGVLHPKKVEQLRLVSGDIIFVTGKCRRWTCVVVMVDNTLDEGKIRLNKVIRRNLHIRLGGKLLQ